ncbi:MAG: site-specific integrase [Thiobacillus sp.]|uniref:tyrosine-type recombinase/integrase n=1 Tax=Thiobacillus sp. TaxID=924 RepID=UPI00273566CB|nr:site-specific integrase [Thiobacillus sp.]MDP3586052.1 site-specific integrase [Thiobacillus sp.]
MANIRERNGRWQARVTLDGQTISKTFTSKAIAQRWARQQQVDFERGLITPTRPTITLGDVIDRYLIEVTPQHRGAQQEKYILKVWRLHLLAKLPINEIKPSDVAAARDARLKVVSSGSVRREIDALSAVFSHACREWQLCDANPISSIRKPAPGRARDRRLLPGELGRVVAAGHKSPDLDAIIYLALETGMRRSELLCLYWRNINLKDRAAHLPITKNGDPRNVPLSREAVAVLERLPRNINGRVFSKNGTSLSDAFTRAVQRARREYEAECLEGGLEPDPKFLINLRLHDLRHEFTSRLIEGGFNLIEAAAVTGHRTLAMLKRYSHVRHAHLLTKLDSISPPVLEQNQPNSQGCEHNS